MKRNTKTYLLIAAVLGIWGTIWYQIVTGLNSEDPELPQNDLDLSFNPKTNKELETFSIQTAERDPFLGTLTRKRTSAKPNSGKKDVKDLVWLPITYQGLVKRQNSSQQVFVVTINNKQHLLKKGQTMDSVTLVKGSAKDIVVRYKKKQKTISVQ